MEKKRRKLKASGERGTFLTGLTALELNNKTVRIRKNGTYCTLKSPKIIIKIICFMIKLLTCLSRNIDK
uniref:Uncharacterized protein n=1 Tax=Fervidobacterium pennivorans TaxID=93466 RepID=A0A7V4KDQ1_FERPE